MNRLSALILTLVAGLALAWFAAATPPPVPATAGPTEFSADRAMADVRQIAKTAHPIDSAAHSEVRDYLMGRLKALGLETRMQSGVASTYEAKYGTPIVLGGDVENLIGVLPGKDRNAPAVSVMAHYDSVPNSPGAADDGAGVATLLETARAMKAMGTPARDVVFVISDGEEGDLLGARSFYATDPLAKHIGAVINMDTRGGGGRAQMFETGRGNGETIGVFRKSAVHPSSSSFAVFMYEHMPNGTDFTVPKDRGLQGINVAFIGRYFDYHSASSTSERLEPGAVQSMGDQVLPMTKALAFAASLPKKAPDAVYGDAFGHFVIAYSPGVGWAILAVSFALFAVGLLTALQRGETKWVEIGRGAAGAVALLLAGFTLAYVARLATGIADGFASQRPLIAQFPMFETALGALALGLVLSATGAMTGGEKRIWPAAGLTALGLIAIALGHATPPALFIGGAAIVAALLSLLVFGRPIRPWGVVAGFLVVGGVFALTAQILAPTMALVFAWPFAIAALSAGLAGLIGPLDRPLTLIVTGVVGIVGLGWVLVMTHGVFEGVGPLLPSALMVFAWLAML
ncbi:MAG: M20/M25/M40 family metallo-hydrolase, partial [Alphaproteobacteria bacterium]|nr:M20/M25/M40 family metallo-hydrolase [Alphaproteobacteria bacterium]